MEERSINAAGVEGSASERSAQIHEALHGILTPTRTLMADAAYDLYLAEVRQQGRSAAQRAWLPLKESEVRDLATQLQSVLSQSDALLELHLPAGTRVGKYMDGCVYVGAEMLGLDVDRPGLHPVEELPLSAEGTNLHRLLSRIREWSSERQFAGIVEPYVVERYQDGDVASKLQLLPWIDAGDVSLQWSLDLFHPDHLLCSLSEERIDELARRFVSDLTILWSDASEIAEQVANIRRWISERGWPPKGACLRAVTLEFSHPTLFMPQLFGLEFVGWDDAFRRGISVESFFEWDLHELDLAKLDRDAIMSRVHSLGATGYIAPIARAILMAAPRGADVILGELASAYATEVRLRSEDQCFEFDLYWDNGIIQARSRCSLDPLCFVDKNRISLCEAAFPEQILLALPGEPLNRVFDEPFLCEAKIVSVEVDDRYLYIEVEDEPWLVNTDKRTMWRSMER